MSEQSMKKVEQLESVVIRFAGDSGDGMQLTGTQFTHSSAIAGNDISTFPDFPAEIRAPQGTLPGVSGFQIHFGQSKLFTPGDAPDVLVAMNPAALKVNLDDLVDQGTLIVNVDSFTADNLKKAGYSDNPLDDSLLEERYRLITVNITQMTLDALSESPLKNSQKQLCKNFFALGMMYWMYGRSVDMTIEWLKTKFASKPDVCEANIKVLKAGYSYGNTTEQIGNSYKVASAPMEPGLYRKISGNEALAMGLVAASQLSETEMVFGGYPITPASDIIAELAKHKNFGVKTLQAEDEIAGIGIALGASFAGALGVTATSGPGICLKSEFMGLAHIVELPLVIVDVQRGGPSTGLPTKTEQSDLLQVLFGRNGDAPMPVLAAKSPADCFEVAIEAVRVALIYNTPVVLLSDGYIANGAEPWRIPDVEKLKAIPVKRAEAGQEYVPYKRDEQTLSRNVAVPGTPGLEHRIGGLEKNEQGNVCYEPENHEAMVRLRSEKVEKITQMIPPLDIHGDQEGDVLIIGWGGTYGAIRTAVDMLRQEGHKVGAIHLRFLNPLPSDLPEVMGRFRKILVAELNMGQLLMLLRSKYLVDAVGYSKVQGKPFLVAELMEQVMGLIK